MRVQMTIRSKSRLVRELKATAFVSALVFATSCWLWMSRGQTFDYGEPLSRKLIFMKNHKCASSTVENIVLRYAYENKLNVVIPASGAYLSRKTLFQRSSLDSAPWRNLSFDVFSLHNRWNHKEVMALLGDGTPTFTIVRDPIDVFVSLYYYWAPVREQYGQNVTNLHQLVETIRSGNQSQLLSKRWIGQFGRNQIAWDLGIAPEFFDNDQVMDGYIEKLDKQFDLVMIASRMDESLVVLRHLLHWPLERMQHLDRNQRKKTNDTIDDLSADERATLYEWLAADTRIYNFFLKRFDEKVEDINRRFSYMAPVGKTYVEYEADKLKEANAQLHKKCVLQDSSTGARLEAEFSEYNGAIGYVVNEEHEDCKLYAWNQSTYLKFLKDILNERANQTQSSSQPER